MSFRHRKEAALIQGFASFTNPTETGQSQPSVPGPGRLLHRNRVRLPFFANLRARAAAQRWLSADASGSSSARLMVFTITAAYLLIATTNGIDWISREPARKALSIATWELLYNGSACLANIAICLLYAHLRERAHTIWLVVLPPLLCFAGGAAWVTMAHYAIRFVGLPSWLGVPMNWASLLFQGGLASGTMIFLVSCVCFGLDSWRLAVQERGNAREAKALAHQAQLQMLRYQLNPHFLFNALNSIRGLILEDPARSRRMVTELANFLRYSLDGRSGEGTVADELEAIENYLAIQRTRFEQHLDAETQIDPAVLNVSLPSFLIHPLVENAVKYGMRTSDLPLRIRIEITRRDEIVSIRVANTGRLIDTTDSPDGAGIGLKNIHERLALVFPERHSFTIGEMDGWVIADIELRLDAKL